MLYRNGAQLRLPQTRHLAKIFLIYLGQPLKGHYCPYFYGHGLLGQKEYA
jgi:hypothetical protein